jgi:hypothetical protein
MKHIVTIQFEIDGDAELVEVLQATPSETWDTAVQTTASILLPHIETGKVSYTGRVDRLHPACVSKGSWVRIFFWKLWKTLKGEYRR